MSSQRDAYDLQVIHAQDMPKRTESEAFCQTNADFCRPHGLRPLDMGVYAQARLEGQQRAGLER